MNDLLATAPKYYRASIARGTNAEHPVDRQGGVYGEGVVYNAAVITRGEALGHGAWIDGEMLDSVADAINASDKGVKARFTHPSMSGDGMGKYLGRFRRGWVDGDVVRADLHFAAAGHRTPEGDLAEYVMDLAEQDPESFGISIVFEHDVEAMAVYADQHADADGDFESPDEMNDRNLPHVRLSKLRAADAVDEPAANPDGLFHRDDSIPAGADALLSYAFGIGDRPGLQFGIDPERAHGFAQRWLEQHGLQLTSKDTDMSNDEVIEIEADETTPAELSESVEQPVEDTPAADEQVETVELSDGQRFLDAFGDQGGVWFAQGKTFEDATQLHIEALQARNEELASKNEELESELSKRSDDRGGEAIELSQPVSNKPAGSALDSAVRIQGQQDKNH